MFAPRLGRPHAAVAACLVIAATAALTVPSFGSDTGVPPGPGCTCHSDFPSTAVNITATGWPEVYTPFERYTVTLAGEGDVLGLKGGFSAQVSKGNLSSPDPHVSAAGTYATHTDPNQRSWVVVWLAPTEDSGNATLTVYVNLVNGDGSEGPEDHWNHATFIAAEKAPEPPRPSNLHLMYASDGAGAIAGQNFSLVAHLTNSTEAPIGNALVAFSARLRFGTLPIGANRTDGNGTARINWSVVAAGDFLFLAHYDGSSKNLSADANATVGATDPNGVFKDDYGTPSVRKSGVFDPVRVPLALIVGGVWVTFALAGRQVLRVRKQGSPSNDGLRDLMRIVVPKFGRFGRKKP